MSPTEILTKTPAQTLNVPANPMALQLQVSREFFERTTSVFTEEHAAFAPKEGMFTVTHQIAHVADTFDWFHDALVDLKGFDMDFKAMEARIMKIESLQEAREWFVRAHDRLLALVESLSPQSLNECLPSTDPIMAGASRIALLAATVEHTAHHRGSLAVYARLLDMVPPMPYGDMPA